MSSTPESLTKDLPLWKKPGEIIVDSKSPTIISEDKTILFQLLFALYVANSKYGINPKNIGDFKVKKEGKHTMLFALVSGGDYDVFTIETEHHVVLDYPITAAETKDDLNTTAIANEFSSLLDKTPAGRRLKSQLSAKLQDYGTGISWGLNLALFHPFFSSFYTRQTITKPTPMDEKMIYYHEPMWSKLEPTKKDDRSKEVEDAFKKGNTYKLEDFENVIESLLNLWDTTYSAGFDNDDQRDYDSSVEALKEAYKQFRIVYPDDNVQGMGKFIYFSNYTRTGSLIDNTLVATEYFQPKPKKSTFDYVEVGPRTRGYISVFLSIIALITETKPYQNAKDIDTALNYSSEFPEATLPVKEIFDKFDNYFRGTANAIQKLQDEYAALETAYDGYKNNISFRQNKHPLSKTKLEKAQSLIKDLTASNFTTNEAAARQALKDAQGDETGWNTQANASAAEKTQYDDIEARLSALQTDYNETKTKYGTVTKTTIPDTIIWPSLEDLKTEDDFNTTLTGINAKLETIKNGPLKTLKENLTKAQGANEFQAKEAEIEAVYDQIEKLRNDAMTEKSNYLTIWAAVTAPNVGLNALRQALQTTISEAQVIATQTKSDMVTINGYLSQIDTWKNEILVYASKVLRQVEGDNLETAYKALNKEHKDIETAIADFKISSADYAPLLEERNRIAKLISDRQAQDQAAAGAAEEAKERAVIDAAKQAIPVPIVAYSKGETARLNLDIVLGTNKSSAKMLLKNTSTEFQSLIENTDALSKSRVAAGAVALGLDEKTNPEQKRKMLAFSQMFV